MLNQFKILAMSAVTMALISVSPAQAQSALNEQPNVGVLHVTEAQLDAQLSNAFDLGLIDSFELAIMRRDLDAIRVKEESYRMRGFTSGGYDRIASRLADFQANLNRRCKKENVIALPVVEIR